MGRRELKIELGNVGKWEAGSARDYLSSMRLMIWSPLVNDRHKSLNIVSYLYICCWCVL